MCRTRVYGNLVVLANRREHRQRIVCGLIQGCIAVYRAYAQQLDPGVVCGKEYRKRILYTEDVRQLSGTLFLSRIVEMPQNPK